MAIIRQRFPINNALIMTHVNSHHFVAIGRIGAVGQAGR